MTAHRCAGGLKKKFDLRSGSQRHRHFIGFFNMPVQASTRGQPFCSFSEKLPHLVTIYVTLGIQRTRGVTIYRYIGISQYTKNLYRIAIRNAYRNISQIFVFLIKLVIFHSILFLLQLQVQRVYACHIYTLIKGSSYSHLSMCIILILLR